MKERMPNAPRKREKPRQPNHGLQNALRAALAGTALLAGTPGTPHAEELAGFNTAKRQLKSVHKKAKPKHHEVRLEGAPQRREMLERARTAFKEHFTRHPGMVDRVDPRGLRDLLTIMESVSQKSVQGTEYDFRGMPAGQMILESPEGAHGNGIVLRFNDQNPEGSGLIERFVVVTARHVADLVPSPNGKRWTNHPTSDVSVVELSREEAMPHTPLFLSRLHAQDDLSGEIVVVLGKDVTLENGSRRHIAKRFPAIYSPRLTSEVFNSMGAPGDPSIVPLNGKGAEDWAETERQRLIVLPPEEMEPDPIAANKFAVAGMSGSPLVYVPDGGKGVEFAGLLISAAHANVNGKAFALGLVLDQKMVWETIHRLPADGEEPEPEAKTERPQEGASEGWLATVQKWF
jgi:hypothetical protein